MLAKVIVNNGLEWLVHWLATVLFLGSLLASRLKPRPLLGGLFGLALAPFLACAFLSSWRMEAIIPYVENSAPLDAENLVQKLREVAAPIDLGFATTAAALVLHTVLFFLARRRTV